MAQEGDLSVYGGLASFTVAKGTTNVADPEDVTTFEVFLLVLALEVRSQTFRTEGAMADDVVGTHEQLAPIKLFSTPVALDRLGHFRTEGFGGASKHSARGVELAGGETGSTLEIPYYPLVCPSYGGSRPVLSPSFLYILHSPAGCPASLDYHQDYPKLFLTTHLLNSRPKSRDLTALKTPRGSGPVFRAWMAEGWVFASAPSIRETSAVEGGVKSPGGVPKLPSPKEWRSGRPSDLSESHSRRRFSACLPYQLEALDVPDKLGFWDRSRHEDLYCLQTRCPSRSYQHDSIIIIVQQYSKWMSTQENNSYTSERLPVDVSCLLQLSAN